MALRSNSVRLENCAAGVAVTRPPRTPSPRAPPSPEHPADTAAERAGRGRPGPPGEEGTPGGGQARRSRARPPVPNGTARRPLVLREPQDDTVEQVTGRDEQVAARLLLADPTEQTGQLREPGQFVGTVAAVADVLLAGPAFRRIEGSAAVRGARPAVRPAPSPGSARVAPDGGVAPRLARVARAMRGAKTTGPGHGVRSRAPWRAATASVDRRRRRLDGPLASLSREEHP